MLKASLLVVLAAATSTGDQPADTAKDKFTEGTTRSADGVQIAYTVGGGGDPALVFIHGGLANRGFWSGQLKAFAPKHRVVALDLGGHGSSGKDRKHWSLPSWGQDVRAVAKAAGLGKMILVGNSMSGPVALEAAKLMPGQVIAVVAVDTCQDLSERIDRKEATAQADAFRKDFSASCAKLARDLFHRDADPALVKDVEQRMKRTAPEVAAAVMESFGDYDAAKAAADANVPIRCLNGDLFPTKVEANRKVVPDFKAIIFSHTGHYPMLEKPAEFNKRLEEVVLELAK
jgi:pimeloyl-ACP methyl ester carboxylesterase